MDEELFEDEDPFDENSLDPRNKSVDPKLCELTALLILLDKTANGEDDRGRCSAGTDSSSGSLYMIELAFSFNTSESVSL
jgi:hypothetical protein